MQILHNLSHSQVRNMIKIICPRCGIAVFVSQDYSQVSWFPVIEWVYFATQGMKCRQP